MSSSRKGKGPANLTNPAIKSNLTPLPRDGDKKRSFSRSGKKSGSRAASAESRTNKANKTPNHEAKSSTSPGHGSIMGELKTSNERRYPEYNVRSTLDQLDSMLKSFITDPRSSVEDRYSIIQERYSSDPVFKKFINEFANARYLTAEKALEHAAYRPNSALFDKPTETYGTPSTSQRSIRKTTAEDIRHTVQGDFHTFLERLPEDRLLDLFRNYNPDDNDTDHVRALDRSIRELVNESFAEQSATWNDVERRVDCLYDYLQNNKDELERRIRLRRASSVDGFQTLSHDDASPGDREAPSPRDLGGRPLSVREAGLFASQMNDKVENLENNLNEEVRNLQNNLNQVRDVINATAGGFRGQLDDVAGYLTDAVPILNQMYNLDTPGLKELKDNITNLSEQHKGTLEAFQHLGAVVSDNFNQLQDQIINSLNQIKDRVVELYEYNDVLQREHYDSQLSINDFAQEMREHLIKTVDNLSGRDKEVKKKLEELQDAFNEKLENQSSRLDGYRKDVDYLRERQTSLYERVGNLPSPSPRGSGPGSSKPPPNSSLPGFSGGSGNGDPSRKGRGKGGGGGFADPDSSRQEIAQADPKGMVSATRAEEKLGQLFPQLSINNEQLNRYFTTKLASVWRTTHNEQDIRSVLAGAARVGNFNGGVVDPVYDKPDEIIPVLKDLKLDDAEVFARHYDSLNDIITSHHVLFAKGKIYETTIDNEMKDRLTRIKQELKDIGESNLLAGLRKSEKRTTEAALEEYIENANAKQLPGPDGLSGSLSNKEQEVFNLAKDYLGFIDDKEKLKAKLNSLHSDLNRYNIEKNYLMDVVKNANIDLSHPAKQIDSLKKNVSDILDAIHTKKKDAEEEKKVLKQELANHRADVERLVRSLWVKEPIERIAAVGSRIQKTVSGGNRIREAAVPRPRAPKEPVRKKTVKKAKKEVVTPVTDADAVWKKIMQNQRWKG